MLDVFCCALGCVTLLWLLKARDASFSAQEATESETNLVQSRIDLTESMLDNLSLTDDRDDLNRSLSLLAKDRDERDRMLALTKREKDDLAKMLALVREEITDKGKVLALTEKDLTESKKELALVRSRLEDKTKELKLGAEKAAATEAEILARKRDMDKAQASIKAQESEKDRLERLVREKEQARADTAKRLTDLGEQMTVLTKEKTSTAAMVDRLKDLEAQVRDSRTQIIDMQGQKARLADKLETIQREADNRFAGIAMTGKRVVFLVDMSGSMELVDDKTPAPGKWNTVRDTVCRVMRSLPELEKFQVIVFSSKAGYLLDGTDWIAFEKEKSIARVHEAITKVQPKGDTNLFSAFEEAFRYREKGLDTIYLFSDGLPTSGPGLTLVQEKTLVREQDRSEVLASHLRRTLNFLWNAENLKQTKVRINSVGFFYESPAVGAFLWSLSRENDGSFVGMSKP